MRSKLINRVLDHAAKRQDQDKWRMVTMALCYGASLKTVAKMLREVS